jgi:hypothetical protein
MSSKKELEVVNDSMSHVNLSEKHSNEDESDKKMSHVNTGEYAILMETNDSECESWYYFIKKDGNEDNLKLLQSQIDSVKEWYTLEDMSIFVIELEPYVSAQTAKEMSKIDMNAASFHRKFDGTLKCVDLDLKKRDSDETKMCKIFDLLGYGQIEEYISDEDIDTDDLLDSCDESDSVSDSGSDSDSEDEVRKKDVNKIPKSLSTDKPSWAKLKQRHRKKE